MRSVGGVSTGAGTGTGAFAFAVTLGRPMRILGRLLIVVPVVGIGLIPYG